MVRSRGEFFSSWLQGQTRPSYKLPADLFLCNTFFISSICYLTINEWGWVSYEKLWRSRRVLSPAQTDATLLANNSQHCWMLHVASVYTPTFLLFLDRRSVAQQCWIRLHSSSNNVGATHAHYAWFTKTYGVHPSHVALQVLTLLGVVASVCTPLPTRTLNSQHCRRNNVGSCCVRLRAA